MINAAPQDLCRRQAVVLSFKGKRTMQIHFEAGIVLCLASRRHEDLERLCLLGGRYFLVGPWSGPMVELQIGRRAESPREDDSSIEVCVEVEPLMHFPDEPEPTDVHIGRPRTMLLREVAAIANCLGREWQRALELRRARLSNGQRVPDELRRPSPRN